MRSTYHALLPVFVLLMLQVWSRACHEPGLCFTMVLTSIAALVFSLLFSFNRTTILALIALFGLQAQWGIAQFMFQHDMGFQLAGESVLTPTTAGVAKFSFNGSKLIRAYGPYPHANIFGGMMLVGLILTTAFAPQAWRRPLTILFLLAIVLSFSRSALMGTLLVPLLQYRKQWRTFLIPASIIFLITVPLLAARLTDPQDNAIPERLRGYTWATTILSAQSITSGIGIGEYENALAQFLTRNRVLFHAWEIAPVHSVPLLAAVELGLVPALSLLVIASYTCRRQNVLMYMPLVPAFLFDHYLATDITAYTVAMFLLFSAYPKGA